MTRPECIALAQKHLARWRDTFIRSITFQLAQFVA